jgi:hypothetical protein
VSYLNRPFVVEHLSRPSLATDVSVSAHIYCISLILYVDIPDGSKPSEFLGSMSVGSGWHMIVNGACVRPGNDISSSNSVFNSMVLFF